jgi:hypothetical protein
VERSLRKVMVNVHGVASGVAMISQVQTPFVVRKLL